MITFLPIPKEISPRVILAETKAYLDEAGVDLKPEEMIEVDMRIPNLDYYHIYKDSRKIGFGVGFPVDNYWFAHRVWLSGKARIYFKQVIDAMNELKTKEGYLGIIAHPDVKTASLYTKHNIMKEL